MLSKPWVVREDKMKDWFGLALTDIWEYILLFMEFKFFLLVVKFLSQDYIYSWHNGPYLVYILVFSTLSTQLVK